MGTGMETTWFWIIAVALAAGVAAWLIRSMTRAHDAAAPGAAKDVEVYKDQLAEADRDLARGTLSDADAARVKTEIARRLLEADRTLQAQTATAARAPSRTSVWIAMALVVAAIGSTFLIYSRIGAPWYSDLPLAQRLADADTAMANRPSQAEFEAAAPTFVQPQIPDDFAALMDQLRAAVDPATATDLTGLGLLAQNEARLGNFTAAIAAQTRLIAVKAKTATAADHTALAEIMIFAAGGMVSREAEEELKKVLTLDPENGEARYFSGLMFVQGGRFDRGFALWQPLVEDSPPDAPWLPDLRAQIEDVAYLAGVNFTLPEGMKGPSEDDVTAAAEMTPEERQAMIEGMVNQLSERLASEDGEVEDWNRLIRSLTVLNRMEEAQSAYDESRKRFKGRASELSFLRLAAVESGLKP